MGPLVGSCGEARRNLRENSRFMNLDIQISPDLGSSRRYVFKYAFCPFSLSSSGTPII